MKLNKNRRAGAFCLILCSILFVFINFCVYAQEVVVSTPIKKDLADAELYEVYDAVCKQAKKKAVCCFPLDCDNTSWTYVQTCLENEENINNALKHERKQIEELAKKRKELMPIVLQAIHEYEESMKKNEQCKQDLLSDKYTLQLTSKKEKECGIESLSSRLAEVDAENSQLVNNFNQKIDMCDLKQASIKTDDDLIKFDNECSNIMNDKIELSSKSFDLELKKQEMINEMKTCANGYSDIETPKMEECSLIFKNLHKSWKKREEMEIKFSITHSELSAMGIFGKAIFAKDAQDEIFESVEQYVDGEKYYTYKFGGKAGSGTLRLYDHKFICDPRGQSTYVNFYLVREMYLNE